MSDRPRVFLVRRSDAGGGGCCKVTPETIRAVPRSPECDAETHASGAVYQALWRRFGDSIELDVADPRNMFYLVGAVWRDARRRGMSFGTAARHAYRGTAQHALVCDGVTLFSREIPSPDDAVAAVSMCLGTAGDRLPTDDLRGS